MSDRDDRSRKEVNFFMEDINEAPAEAMSTGAAHTDKTKPGWYETHPVAYSLISVAAAIVLTSLVSNILVLPAALAEVASGAEMSRERIACLTMPSKVVTLLIFWFIFRKRLRGFFVIRGLGAGILMGWSVLAISAFTVIGGILDHKAFGDIGTAVWNGIQPGISEEVLYRIIPIAFALRVQKKDKLVIPVMTVTGVIFGLIHGANILAGADVTATVLQVIYAAGTGLMFAIIYMKTGNLWITVFLHSLTDIVYYLGAEEQSSAGILSEQLGLVDIGFLIVYAALYFANAFWLYRRTGKTEFTGTWDRIWDGRR
jgi:uncharacterized protein